MLKIRRSHGRLSFNMGIPIHGKDGLYIEKGLSVSDVSLKDMGKIALQWRAIGVDASQIPTSRLSVQQPIYLTSKETSKLRLFA